MEAIRVAEMGNTVLVGHSGAGPLLPAIANVTTTVAVIFVDAGLPHPGKSWFDPAVLNEAIADPPLRLRFVDELPRLSLDYFEQPTLATVWDGPHCLPTAQCRLRRRR